MGVAPAPQEVGHFFDSRAEGENPCPPDTPLQGVDQGEQRRLMVPHRSADIPENDEFGKAFPAPPETQLDPLAPLAETVPCRRREVDRAVPRGPFASPGSRSHLASKAAYPRSDCKKPPSPERRDLMAGRRSVRTVAADADDSTPVHPDSHRSRLGRRCDIL